MFIENNMSRDIDTICLRFKAFITFVHRAIANKNTRICFSLKFGGIVILKIRKILTTKHS